MSKPKSKSKPFATIKKPALKLRTFTCSTCGKEFTSYGTCARYCGECRKVRDSNRAKKRYFNLHPSYDLDYKSFAVTHHNELLAGDTIQALHEHKTYGQWRAEQAAYRVTVNVPPGLRSYNDRTKENNS